MGVDLSRLGPAAQRQIIAKLAVAQPKKNKYGAEAVGEFASRKEKARYDQLQLLERASAIRDLRTQVRFDLLPTQRRSDGKAERGIYYVADFVYERDGKTVVEDVKGDRDPSSVAYRVFSIKRKMMLFFHGIEVQEI